MKVTVKTANPTVNVGSRMGVQGPAGIGLKILGVYATLSALQAAHPTGAVGDSYLVVNNVYVWDAIAEAWHDAGTFRGPTGEDGKPGQIRFTGHGAPGTIIGAEPQDTYLDLDTGTLYQLT